MAKTLIELNSERWNNCSVSAEAGPVFDKAAKRLTTPEAKARYQKVEKLTGVPWWFIAVVHERESSQNWNAQLGQGDPLNKKSVHDPKGRGPFKTWEDGAVDALVNCPPFASKNKDWSPGSALTMLEKYNGLGSFYKGLPSPYIWSGTNQYTKGKYVADHVYDPNKVDSQLGCAGLLKFMGVFKKTGTIIAATTVAAGAGAYTYSFWDTIHHHWTAYTISLSLLAGFIYLCVYAYKQGKENVIKSVG
jgi:lysozyme family protein